MRKIILNFILLSSFVSFSQNSGDILFVGFNADGDKDFSIVALKDLAINTVIYFTDNEPNIAGDGNNGSEGVLKWDTGASVIEKGTIVVFTDIDSASNPNFGSSVGVLSVVDAGFNISTNGDVVYATYGNPATNNVSKWICAIQNSNTGFETNFGVTNLSVANDYLVIDNTASKDGGEYSGLRSGKTIEEYRSLILDEENWMTNTTNGESFLPLNQSLFSFLTLGLTKSRGCDIRIKVINHKLVTNKGDVLAVFNMLGEKQENSQLTQGLYIVTIIVEGNIYNVKISI